MDACTYRLSLDELLAKPAVALRLVGADENDNESGDQNESGSEGEQEDEDEDSSGSDEDKDKKSKAKTGGAGDAKDKKITYLEEEKDRHYELRRQAEKDLKAANEKIAKLEKDGTTDEETKQKLVNLERDNASLTQRIHDLSIENGFLKSNTHKWRDNRAALRLADLSRVELDDKTGEVHGLDAALDKLAAEAPYLLADDTNEKDESKDKDKRQRTGDKPGQQGGGSDKDKANAQVKKATLEKRFPGIRR